MTTTRSPRTAIQSNSSPILAKKIPVKRKPLGNLPSGVGVTKVHYSNGPYWRVRLGKRFTGGKVEIKSFAELEDARNWIFGGKSKRAGEVVREVIEEGIVNLKDKHGQGAFALSPSQRSEAENAFRRLPSGTSLTTVIDDWLKRRAPAGGVKTTKEVGVEFLVSRRAMGVRSRTYTQYESHLRIINEEFGELPIADVERSHIEDWLSESEWAARTRKNYLVTFTTLLNFCQDRELCPGNPAARIERPILEDRPPGILTVDQARKLLLVAAKGVAGEKGARKAFAARPQMVPGLAIGLFAGLRRSEICRLDWSEIDLESGHIEVKASKAKTRQRRLVTIGSNLLAWIKPFAKKNESVTPSKNEDVFGENLKEIAEAAGIQEWPHNALRHSFGSYFFAKNKDENKTAAEMGNTPNIVFKHYRALVKEKDALEYWRIQPKRPLA